MNSDLKDALLNRILLFQLVFESPLQLTEQLEWHEFAPLGFLLIQAASPQEILEVGTSFGDSYLSFCQAVRACSLATRCTCITRPWLSDETADGSSRFERFRASHDALYSGISTIEPSAPGRWRLRDPNRAFDLMHFSNPESGKELVEMCSTWLPNLSSTGVGLISGRGQFEQSGLKPGFDRVSLLYCTRVLQMNHWVAIMSRKPIGIVRDLLLSSQEEFLPVAKLLNLLGGRIRLQHALVRQARESEQLKDKADRLASVVGELRTKLASIEEAEMDAQIRFAQTDIRLEQAWSQKELLSKQLERLRSEGKPSTAKEESGPSEGNDSGFVGAKEILRQVRQHYTGEFELSIPTGKQLWDECGRSVLSSILAKHTRLIFPKPLHPSVSVIVVLRNKIHLSVLSLATLLLQSDESYELIVVDNGSSDETADVLALVDNATVILNTDNLGFGPACMQGSCQASGKFLCFLNNDAVLQPQALSSSLAAFADNSDVGAVGGKILLADGSLQEAGGIVWRDGKTYHYGRGDDPFLPQYSFRRPVDYCSAVFLVTPRELFAKVGGFDKRYAPAYYEDVDYCMQMWDKKKQVLYQPRSLVHHYENASSQDVVGMLELIRMGHLQFTARWRSALRAHEINRAENIVRARISAQSRSKRCVYFLGDLSVTLAGSHLDARLQNLWSFWQDGYLVTCLFTNRGEQLEAGKYFPDDVEIRDVNTMAASEVHQYCKASDVIILAERQEVPQNILEVLAAHSEKVMSPTGSLHRDDRQDTARQE